MKSIALTMIVKNEERCLARCLESARPWVDQIIVLDTGSTDRSVEIAREFGARVHQRRWTDDFAAARNAALAQSSADWNLILDADEWISGGAGYLDLLRTDTARRVHYVSLQNQLSEADETLKDHAMLARILPKGVRYQGRIHEQPVHRLPRVSSSLVISHDGYLPAQKAGKQQRNIRLLEAAIQASPDDPYYHYQLGKEHDAAQQPALALQHYWQALALESGQPGWRHDLCIRIMECLKRTDNLERGIDFASQALNAWEHSPDFHYMAASLLAEQMARQPGLESDYLPLIESLCLKALDLGDAPHLTGAVTGRGSFLAAHLLSESYERANLTDKASQARQWCETLYQHHLLQGPAA